MAIETYAATSTREGTKYVVTIDTVRVRGEHIKGTGFTKDAAAIDAKRELAAHLRKSVHDISLVLDGGH